MRLCFDILILSIVITLIGIINLKPAIAQDFSGPVALSTGGAGVGSALGPDAHFVNPAGLAYLEGFFANYLYRYEDFATDNGVGDWAVQITDAHEGVFLPASFSYQKSDQLVAGQRWSSTNFQLSGGGKVLPRLAVGLTGRRWEQINPGGVTEEIWQGGLGVLGYPGDGISFGFTAMNVLDEHVAAVWPQLGVGGEVFYQDIFRLRLDGLYPTKFNPRKKGIVAVGFETMFESGMRLRGGSRWDDVENSAKWTAGLGWEGPKLSMHYAFEKDYREDRFRQSFDLRTSF